MQTYLIMLCALVCSLQNRELSGMESMPDSLRESTTMAVELFEQACDGSWDREELVSATFTSVSYSVSTIKTIARLQHEDIMTRYVESLDKRRTILDNQAAAEFKPTVGNLCACVAFSLGFIWYQYVVGTRNVGDLTCERFFKR